ncbi:hypothetical protein [Streptomyces sp. C10-9-1]|uniref:hypothetical protein n=1 Tax=Streptomyces sp. C10-9-1 TaxID=1859285 RepID=UPI003F4A64D3
MKRKNTGRRVSGDPRKSGGDIVGPGGPHDRHGVILDDRTAVLLDHATVTLVETLQGGPLLALLLEGRINKTTDRARNLYLMDEDGAAALVSELLALAGRIGPAFEERFMERVLEHTARGENRPLPAEDQS